MRPIRSLRVEVVGAALLLAGAVGLAAAPGEHGTAVQLAQEVYSDPVGEGDGMIGGPMAYGAPVGSPPVGGPMLYGAPVGSAPIGGPMLYGQPVGSPPLNSPMLYGAPMESSGDDAPIGGAPLY